MKKTMTSAMLIWGIAFSGAFTVAAEIPKTFNQVLEALFFGDKKPDYSALPLKVTVEEFRTIETQIRGNPLFARRRFSNGKLIVTDPDVKKIVVLASPASGKPNLVLRMPQDQAGIRVQVFRETGDLPPQLTGELETTSVAAEENGYFREYIDVASNKNGISRTLWWTLDGELQTVRLLTENRWNLKINTRHLSNEKKLVVESGGGLSNSDVYFQEIPLGPHDFLTSYDLDSKHVLTLHIRAADGKYLRKEVMLDPEGSQIQNFPLGGWPTHGTSAH